MTALEGLLALRGGNVPERLQENAVPAPPRISTVSRQRVKYDQAALVFILERLVSHGEPRVLQPLPVLAGCLVELDGPIEQAQMEASQPFTLRLDPRIITSWKEFAGVQADRLLESGKRRRTACNRFELDDIRPAVAMRAPQEVIPVRPQKPIDAGAGDPKSMEGGPEVRLGLLVRSLRPERRGELPPLPRNIGMDGEVREEGLQTRSVERQDGFALQPDAEGAEELDAQSRGERSGSH